MTADYQVLAFRDIAPVKQVGIFTASPLTLDIRGKNFSGVSSVLVNNVESPEFFTESLTRVLAQVPSSQLKARISSVRVVLSRAELTKTTSIALEAIVPGARATGFTRLLQAFLRILFTNPGEDFWDRTVGAGLRRVVGSAGTPGELKAAASYAIGEATTQLIRIQALNPGLERSERLKSATLLQAEYVPATTSMNIRLQLVAMDGTTGNPVVSVSA